MVRDDRIVLLKARLRSFPLCLQQNDLKSTSILSRLQTRDTATFREDEPYNINDSVTQKMRHWQWCSSKNLTKAEIKNYGAKAWPPLVSDQRTAAESGQWPNGICVHKCDDHDEPAGAVITERKTFHQKYGAQNT